MGISRASVPNPATDDATSTSNSGGTSVVRSTPNAPLEIAGNEPTNRAGPHDKGQDKQLVEGSRFGRYKIGKLLGSGGMGAVYEATHLELKKPVAIKILHPSFAANEEVQNRFMREGETAARIRHPHIVDVTDVGILDGVPFLVMELLQGESLGGRIRRGQLTVQETVDLMLPVCAAVSAAHEAGVIHRDLKPENIFLAKVGKNEVRPKVVDFGVSKILDNEANVQVSMTNSMVGSPAYMSPEQIMSSKNVDARSDQYALGVTMYECFAGQKPFQGNTLFLVMGKVVQGECPHITTHRPDLPIVIAEAVHKAMRPNAQDRYDSVLSFGRVLLPFASPRAQLLWSQAFSEGDGQLPEEVTGANIALTHLPGENSTNSAAVLDSSSISKSQPNQNITQSKVIPVGQTTGVASQTLTSPESTVNTKPNRLPLYAAIGLAATLMGAVGWRLIHSSNSPNPSINSAANTLNTNTNTQNTQNNTNGNTNPHVEQYRVSIRVVPAVATIELDGHSEGQGAFDRSVVRDGTEHVLRVQAPGFEERVIRFRDEPPPPTITLTAEPPTNVAVQTPENPGNTPPHSGRNPRTNRPGHPRENNPGNTANNTQTNPNNNHTNTGTNSSTGVGANGAAIIQ